MRRYLAPYAAFVGSFVLFVWLIRAQEGAQEAAALVLALFVWRAVDNRTRT